MSEDWNLQTNLKNKPNAQGTLFSGGTRQMNPQRRYPRGYTPQRMRDVRGATKARAVDDWLDSNTNAHEGPVIEDLHRTLARSTVPVKHLNKVQFHVQSPERSWDMARDGVAGEYVKSSWIPNTGKIILGVNSATDATVIHEVGHHVSHAFEQTEHSEYDTPRKRGEEEGFADAYADKHFRPLPKREQKRRMLDDSRRGLDEYDPLPGQVVYKHGGWGGRADFSSGYNRTRPFGSRVPNEGDVARANRSKVFEDNAQKARQGSLF